MPKGTRVPGVALIASTALEDAIAQLESTERDLLAQRGVIDTHLEATREAIAVVRRVVGLPARPEKTLNLSPSAEPAPARPLQSGKAGAAAAAGRERRLLGLIASGTRQLRDLRNAVVVPEGVSSIQHDSAIRNALTRMRMNGLVVRADEGWALTAAGRKAAAAAAKEEP